MSNIIVIIMVLVLLLSLISLIGQKLSTYFNTFLFLAKKKNYDKANYISNSSFFKYFYSNKLLYGYLGIELFSTIILILLSIIAYGGYVFRNHMNYGYLNYNYGDPMEYSFINLFIYLIIAYAIIYGCSYIYWIMNDKIKDNNLDTKENILRNILANNLDYDLLYDYYKDYYVEPKNTEKYIMNLNKQNVDFFTADNVFNYYITYHILSDSGEHQRFILIKKELLNIIKNTKGIKGKDKEYLNTNRATNKEAIRKSIKDATDLYIISKYNHNSSLVLRPFKSIIAYLKKDIDAPKKVKLKEIEPGIEKKHTDMQTAFMETIKLYKEIYDKYYTYYIVSVLLSNFLIIYVVLVFIYIIIKIALHFDMEDNIKFNIYYFFTYLNSYGIILITIYYLITCPIIIFGFN